MKEFLVFLTLCGFFYFSFAQPPLVWTRVYDGSTADYAFGVSTDDANNIIVTGSTYNGVDYDFFTIKYTPTGDTIWTRFFDTGGSDIAHGVVVDVYGDILIAGSSRLDTIYDYLTIKYDAGGDLLWQARYETGLDNIAASVVADSARNIIVTGYSFNGFDYDYLTVKYNASGDTIWSRRFDAGFNDIANDITSDPMGNVVVTGSSVDTSIDRYTFLTVKYSPVGETLWLRRYHYDAENSFAYAVAADVEGNIIVSGNPWYPAKFITIKYDSFGDSIWLRELVPGAVTEYYARDIAVDDQNDIIITGEYYYGASFDYYTFKYTSVGDSVWVLIYGSGSGIDEYARGVACDAAGGIIIAGHVFNNGNVDYLTVKYDEQGAVAEQMLIPVRTGGSVLHTPQPNPFSNNCFISFESRNPVESEITICDVSGRELRTVFDRRCASGMTRVNWDGTDDNGRSLPSGVYFVRLETPDQSVTKKIVKLR